MISRIDLRGDALPEGGALRDLLPRAEFDVEAALEKVRPICEDVHHRGTAALIEYARKFDGVELERVRVPAEALKAALDALDPAVRAALEESIRRARIVHRNQRRTEHTTQVVPGGTVTEKWVPVERVGLYAPGGRSVYPSSVVMNVVPAQEAGVESIALASPPQKPRFEGDPAGGLPHPTILAACALLGVDEVYAAGGAVAVAMFAYGTEDCLPVNMVTGPGNIWVAAAKRYFTGKIGIDTEAGPTEIAVLADSTADPVHVAADLISQAEHDPLAAAVLVTDSEELAAAVEMELEPQVAATKHVEDRIRPALAGKQSAIVLVDSLEDGLKVVDAYGAEHLEIQTSDAAAWAARVRNAGAIFVGPWAPVSLGDYCAGSNHVLPTGGCACHSSGLSVQSFLRGIHIVDYTRDALAEVTHHVVTLAEAEDLPAHGAALKARFGWKVPTQ
ncbi:histidinol dehydrogenase [Streptomyces sp. M-16]|uniref:histidinol dehydrogenase n=1 Tax=Streptomyces sp. M-16 TaxID=3233040 RepID=UPI003F99BB30